MDLRYKEIQGFYSFPVDNLRASSYLIQYIRESVIISRLHSSYFNFTNFTWLEFDVCFITFFGFKLFDACNLS